MEELISLLHTGGYSCTIASKGEVHTLTQRGVANIYNLLTQEPELLKGASIIDKVVGKEAIALTILGGIKELYTDIISAKALESLQKLDIKVGFTEKVLFIWNRNYTGGCLVEIIYNEVESAKEILPLTRDFLEKIRNEE